MCLLGSFSWIIFNLIPFCFGGMWVGRFYFILDSKFLAFLPSFLCEGREEPECVGTEETGLSGGGMRATGGDWNRKKGVWLSRVALELSACPDGEGGCAAQGHQELSSFCPIALPSLIVCKNVQGMTLLYYTLMPLLAKAEDDLQYKHIHFRKCSIATSYVPSFITYSGGHI